MSSFLFNLNNGNFLRFLGVERPGGHAQPTSCLVTGLALHHGFLLFFFFF